MRYLVTGANGFVGSRLCAALLRSGKSVTASARRSLPATAQHPLSGAQWIADATVDSTHHWGVALQGVDVVVHLAARVHVMQELATNPLLEFRAVNVAGTLNLARQAAAAGARRFVYLSSVKVNGESTQAGHPFVEADTPHPQDAYSQSKHEAEMGLKQVARDTGIEVVIVRPPLVYGPGVKANLASLMRAVQHGWPLPLGAIHNQRSLVALDNLVHFIITCATHPGAANQTYLVSDGQDLSTTELVQGLARAADVNALLVPVPAWALKGIATLLGRSGAVQRLCGNLQVNIAKARQDLDWIPPLSIQEGLRRVVLGEKWQDYEKSI